MSANKSDIQPADDKEAELLRQVNMIMQSSPSAAQVMLEVGEQRMPGFKKMCLDKEGIIELKASPSGSDKPSP